MAVRSKFVGALAGVALVAASASPAAARGRYQWHRHHDRVDAGAVVGVLAAVGIFAAIASAANDSRDRDRGYDDRNYDERYRGYDDRNYDRGYDGRGYDDGRYDDRGAYDDGSYGAAVGSADPGYAGASGADAAANACAIAARDRSTQAGGFAEVRSITGVRVFGNGYDVTGTLDQRSSYQAADSRLRSFRCIWDNGQVASVNFN